MLHFEGWLETNTYVFPNYGGVMDARRILSDPTLNSRNATRPGPVRPTRQGWCIVIEIICHNETLRLSTVIGTALLDTFSLESLARELSNGILHPYTAIGASV